MNIWLVIIVIAIISITLSVVALRDLENKFRADQVKKKLFKGRIIFHRA